MGTKSRAGLTHLALFLFLFLVPAGTDGTLEFGSVRVLDEAKQMLSLKNKGKYEIGFR